jgi:hypothetical protein
LGAKLDRAERKKVMALARRREIDVVLVTELSRWGRSTLDLLHTLKELDAWRVSVIAMNGLAFDLSTPHGRMMARSSPASLISNVNCCRSASAPASPRRRRAASASAASPDSGRNPTASLPKFSPWSLKAAAIA